MGLKRYAKEDRRICNLSEVKEFEVFSPVCDTIITSKDITFPIRYRCECGKLYGKKNENETCKLCNTPVRYNEQNFEHIFVGMIHDDSMIDALCCKNLNIEEYINKPDSLIKNCALTRSSVRDAFNIVSFKSNYILVEVVGIIEF